MANACTVYALRILAISLPLNQHINANMDIKAHRKSSRANVWVTPLVCSMSKHAIHPHVQ